jgi:CRP/FNR family transcriptional regulator, cyclic AMP receptor protein
MHGDRVELLQRMPIFGALREDTLETLLVDAPLVERRAGECFFREHDAATAMYVLEVGRVLVFRSWHGGDHPLHALHAGDCFGEMALMDLQPRSASVRALEDCRAIELATSALYRLFERDPEQFALIQMNLGRELSRRLRAADDALFRARLGALPPVGA